MGGYFDTREEIKKDLLDQLERNGTVGEYYIDLVSDYLSLWDTKNSLIEDIDTRGVITTYNNGGGQSGVKKNDSVEQLVRVNKQMLSLLDNIGIKPIQENRPDGNLEM